MSLVSDVSRAPRFLLLALECIAARRTPVIGAEEPGVLSIVGRTKSDVSAGVEGSGFTRLPLMDSLSIIDTSSGWETVDWLLVRPRTELPSTEEVVLPPLPRLACERLFRVLDSGTEGADVAAACLPRRGCLLFGEGARSLTGLTLLDCGRTGEDFRALATFPGTAFQRVSLEGDGAGLACNLTAAGVASSLATSNGLNDAACDCVAGEMPNGLDMGPGTGTGGPAAGGSAKCATPGGSLAGVGVCGATAKDGSMTPPRGGGCAGAGATYGDCGAAYCGRGPAGDGT